MRFFISIFTLVCLLTTPLFPWGLERYSPVKAASVEELNRQKQQLEQKLKDAEQQKKIEKTVAERAADRIDQVGYEIGVLENNIGSTEKNMAETQDKIKERNQEIAHLESELRKINDQQSALVREMYIMSVSQPDSLVFFSNEPISTRETEQAQFSAIKKSVVAIYVKTQAAKIEVEKNRTELVRKNEELENLKKQQDEQKIGLASFQDEQAQLKENAEYAVQVLEEKANNARRDIAKIEQQISSALTEIIRRRSQGPINGGQNAGQRVNTGTIVGHMGSTGYSTGPHVHFEVRDDNVPVNPIGYINNGTLIWPVPPDGSNTISQGFGYTSYAAAGAYGGGIHTGIDLAGPHGQAVYAPAGGVVIMNQYYGGYGNAWAMQLDNGLVVLLGHLTGG